MPPPTPRIGIIGAGPGGLSLARLLTERGFPDVTVLERADRVGGKSLTVFHEGIGHELGTCYSTLGYRRVKRWMRQCGVSEYQLTTSKVLTTEGRLLEFPDFVRGSNGRIDVLSQLARYLREWFACYRWEMLGAPDDARASSGRLMRDEMAEPFAAWLDERGFDFMSRFAVRSVATMGYGTIEDVPTLYGLRWNSPSLLLTGFLGKIHEPIPGWQPFWSALADTLDVRLSHTVESVTRSGNTFAVHTDRGDFTFDHLVLTLPLDEAARWFPFTADERTAFAVDTGERRWRDFRTTLIAAQGWFRDGNTWCTAAEVSDWQQAQRGRLIGARRTGDKSAVAQTRAAIRSDVYVCYQYGDGTHTAEDSLRHLHEDLAARGAVLRTVLRHCRWKYAPQFTAEAIRAGAVSRFERRQGTGNLWISGASASHEAVSSIVNYNVRLVERMAAAFAGRPPSSPETLARLARGSWFRLYDK